MPSRKPVAKTENEDIVFLSPTRETLRIKGKLSYCESDQAWNLLRLKKEILHEFPHLKNKQGDFIYLMKLHHSYDDLREELDVLQTESPVVPIILFIGKEKPEA
jgi:hypothetical protein